jgi:hypothetical protein
MNFLAFGANFISSWIRMRIQETNRMWIRIRNTAQQYSVSATVYSRSVSGYKEFSKFDSRSGPVELYHIA